VQEPISSVSFNNASTSDYDRVFQAFTRCARSLLFALPIGVLTFSRGWALLASNVALERFGARLWIGRISCRTVLAIADRRKEHREVGYVGHLRDDSDCRCEKPRTCRMTKRRSPHRTLVPSLIDKLEVKRWTSTSG
jgi:hypothetical protein